MSAKGLVSITNLFRSNLENILTLKFLSQCLCKSSRYNLSTKDDDLCYKPRLNEIQVLNRAENT